VSLKISNAFNRQSGFSAGHLTSLCTALTVRANLRFSRGCLARLFSRLTRYMQQAQPPPLGSKRRLRQNVQRAYYQTSGEQPTYSVKKFCFTKFSTRLGAPQLLCKSVNKTQIDRNRHCFEPHPNQLIIRDTTISLSCFLTLQFSPLV